MRTAWQSREGAPSHGGEAFSRWRRSGGLKSFKRFGNVLLRRFDGSLLGV